VKPLLPIASVVLAAPMLAGCMPYVEYRPDPEAPLGLAPAQVRTLGCVDIGVQLGKESPASLLLMLRGGNCCSEPELVDVSAIRILGYRGEGEEPSLLELRDPRREIEPRHLDASSHLAENIQIGGDGGADDFTEICVHLEGVAREAPHARPKPICFRRNAEGWAP
jgi:hypothetical protein